MLLIPSGTEHAVNSEETQEASNRSSLLVAAKGMLLKVQLVAL